MIIHILCLFEIEISIFIKFIFYYINKRGHTVKSVTESFQLSKDAGFKVVAHMMPDLPNVGMERDLEQFKVSFFLLRIVKKNYIIIFLLIVEIY